MDRRRRRTVFNIASPWVVAAALHGRVPLGRFTRCFLTGATEAAPAALGGTVPGGPDACPNKVPEQQWQPAITAGLGAGRNSGPVAVRY
jgi:hypothetical protein